MNIALQKISKSLKTPLNYKVYRTKVDNKKKVDRPGWIPPEITANWNIDPYAYQTEEETMPQGGPHGQLSGYLYELLHSYLEKRGLMLLLDSFLFYRDQYNIKQRIGPDLLLMPLRKPVPSSYDLDTEISPPSCIIEITSPESHHKDLDKNIVLYSSLGISTYLVIDAIIPHKDELREQIELHVFKEISGKLIEKNPNKEGYLILPEMGLKIKAEGQKIILVDKLTGDVLFDMAKLKDVLEVEITLAKTEAQRADVAEQRVEAEAQRANAAEQRVEAEAQRANVAEKQVNKEKQRAERLAQLLREHGLDPDKECA
ncbi:Uma2 family endonuclease [Candidatus Parabeggiatoa sp. HSG14]|uniref:Uma2 family endonuclease n=1 Tax=Candidatus Parabeggiatoa sp. HSG14 TaxID=3055593 RepID=UPI0025A7BE22|nr:Uma2 family endonuclease [Thiotrichales bacterium HSG14]